MFDNVLNTMKASISEQFFFYFFIVFGVGISLLIIFKMNNKINLLRNRYRSIVGELVYLLSMQNTFLNATSDYKQNSYREENTYSSEINTAGLRITKEILEKITNELYYISDLKLHEYVKMLTNESNIDYLYRRYRYRDFPIDPDFRPIKAEIGYYNERMLSRLGEYISKEIKSIRNDVSVLSESLKKTINEQVQEVPLSANYSITPSADIQFQFIREISHSLNTPLSLIELSLINLKNDGILDNKTFSDYLNNIENNTNLCKSILTAFREAVNINTSKEWQTDSIDLAVSNFVSEYQLKNELDIMTDINLPNKMPNYSSNFVLALLLPIVENAIESVNEGGTLYANYHNGPDACEINIKNTLDPESLSQFKDSDIYKIGFSTKKGHDGIGLSTVTHLLSVVTGSKCSHSIVGNSIQFSVTLPLKRR